MEHRSFTFAALTTAKTAAAISSIQLVGDGAGEIFKKIFKPLGNHHFDFSTGSILHGNIINGGTFIDEVIIGCEEADCFSINCHGNPIIVENILELLKKEGAKITEAKEIVAYLARKKYGYNTIAIEAEIAITESSTLDGAKIIQHQRQMGLLQSCQWWLENFDSIQFDDIKAGAEQVLDDSKISSFFIKGVKIVIAGPPNSGKSTLFNRLCGKEKAIVTDIAGTTRDWLGAKIRLKKIEAEFFDTAGIDDILSEKNIIDAQSQGQAMELIKNCDLVLFVQDCCFCGDNEPPPQVRGLNKLVVLNKCDLAGDLLADGLNPPRRIKISAKTGSGIRELIGEIETVLGVVDFDMKKTVCFTDRQEKIMRQIASADKKEQIKKLIQELLKGDIFV